MFRYLVVMCVLVLPSIAAAAVGISPAGINATLPAGTTKDGVLSFMRDDVDSKTAMYVSAFADKAFILTEGTEYFMDVGVRSIEIPYRFDTATYEPGTYTAILYVSPERAEARAVSNGVAVRVQGGVRATMTVTEPENISWAQAAEENIYTHLAVYRDTAKYYATTALASVTQLFTKTTIPE